MQEYPSREQIDLFELKMKILAVAILIFVMLLVPPRVSAPEYPPTRGSSGGKPLLVSLLF